MKLKIALVATALVAALFLFATPAIHAQNVYGTIHGTVTDTTGAVIPGATVTATNTATNVKTTVTTDANGYYVFPQLQTGGPYTVTITSPNFQQFQSTGVKLALNANLAVSAALQPGSSTTVIQVQAAAVQVETSDTQLKSDITGATMEALPLLSRNPVALQKTAPGVMESSDRFGTFSTNGSQTPQNAYILDGTDINDGPLQEAGITPNIDALAEFQVVSSTLNPEYSRNSGAIVSETIKSGTNHIHGDGFEFYRDTFLNNGNYFSPTRPPFHQNVYGGSLGGPVLRDKLFFFLAYQGNRNATATTNFTNTFSPAEMAGMFTGITGNVSSTNPTGDRIPVDTIPGCPKGTYWAACVPSGSLTIPTSAFDPIAYSIAQKYAPAQTTTVGGIPGNFFNSANTGALDQGIIRIDFHLSSHDTLWASSVFQSDPSTTGIPFVGASVPGFAMRAARHFKVFSAAYTHTFSPTALNDLRAGYYRFNYADVYPVTPIPPSSFGFAITPQTSNGASLPVISILNGPTFGFSNDGPQPRKDENYDFNDNFTKIVGGHSLKFGAHFEKFVVSNPFYADNNGSYAYNGKGHYSSGNPILDYFLGIPDTYSQESGGFIDALAFEYYAYAQDSWKVNSSLTLNYGLSWDAESPNSNRQFNGVGVNCFELSTRTSNVFPGAFPGLLFPGDKGCNSMGGPTTKWNHFGPRIGFAWSPSSGPSMLIGEAGSHNFSLRGGFGVYYNRDQEEGSLQNVSAPPFSLDSSGITSQVAGTSPSFANPFADIYTGATGALGNPFPFAPPRPGAVLNWTDYDGLDINAFDPKYTTPIVYNFNLNIQRALPGAMVLQVGYVGSLGHHLASVYGSDPITPAGHAACLANPACASDGPFIHLDFPQYTALANLTSPVDPATLVPYYLAVGTQATLASSNYNSLQIQLQKAATHGLTFNISYTYSHALDNSSGLESSGFNGRGINWFPGYQYLSYGDSDFDARNRVAAYYTYEVPLTAGMKSHLVVREALGGWTFSGITAVQNGFPVTLMEVGDYNSLWCDAYFYYYCPDSPDTSTYHIKSLAPRRIQTFNEPGIGAPGTGNYWFDPSVFSPEPIGTFGNTKRNFFHGPGFNYSNMSLAKSFALGRGESRYIQLFVQAFNVFNHANFAQPDGNFLDGTFGAITSVIQPANTGGDPQPGRAVQIGGKIAF